MYGSQHSRNTFSDLFFLMERYISVLGVSLHSSESARKHVFVNFGIGA